MHICTESTSCGVKFLARHRSKVTCRQRLRLGADAEESGPGDSFGGNINPSHSPEPRDANTVDPLIITGGNLQRYFSNSEN